MGLFGAIGKIFGGGAGSKGYKSPNIGRYEEQVRRGVKGRRYGPTFRGLEGVKKATAGYDFGDVEKAAEGFRRPSLFGPTAYTSGYKPSDYTPTKFSFKGLPQQYGARAYERGAKDIRREGAGQLESLKESVGTRRPGLLLKAGQQSQRDVGERLAGLRTDIGLRTMEKDVDLGVQEQLQNAEEKYRAAGFSEDQARFKAQEELRGYTTGEESKRFGAESESRRLRNLFDVGMGKVAAQKDIVTGERGEAARQRQYRDQAIDYIMDLFRTTGGFEAGRAAQGTARSSATKQMWGNILGG